MSISVEQIDEWRAVASETSILEFKEARNQIDSQRLCEYCVAIANEQGGNLILGITDKLPRLVVGTSAIINPVATVQMLFESLRFRVEIEEVAHPDGRVVVVQIPSRPRGSAYDHKGRYLMRTGEALVSMSQDQLRRIFEE